MTKFSATKENSSSTSVTTSISSWYTSMRDTQVSMNGRRKEKVSAVPSPHTLKHTPHSDSNIESKGRCTVGSWGWGEPTRPWKRLPNGCKSWIKTVGAGGV